MAVLRASAVQSVRERDPVRWENRGLAAAFRVRRLDRDSDGFRKRHILRSREDVRFHRVVHVVRDGVVGLAGRDFDGRVFVVRGVLDGEAAVRVVFVRVVDGHVPRPGESGKVRQGLPDEGLGHVGLIAVQFEVEVAGCCDCNCHEFTCP